MNDTRDPSSFYSGSNPPPPPPKSYSQEPSRSNTPQTSGNSWQQDSNRYSQQYAQPPPLPPQISQQSYSASPGPQHANQQQYLQNDGQYRFSSPHPSMQQQSTGPPMPTIFDLSESVKKQTTADLAKLLSEPEVLNSLAHLHPAYTASLQPLQNQLSMNASMAGQVSSLEAQVKNLREQTGQLMLQHTSLQTQWRRKQTEMDAALAPWGPRAMYQRLIAGISEQESVLSAMQESFLEGGGSSHEYNTSAGAKASEKEVTDWVKRIREGTTVLEKRREMRARWDEGRVGGWR